MVDTETIPTRDDPEPTRRGRIGALAVATVAGVLVLALVAWLAASSLAPNDGWDVIAGQPVSVTIEAGASGSEIFEQLEAAGVARAGDLEAAAVRLGVANRLRAGTFAFTTDMDPGTAIERLVEGPPSDAQGRFVVIEGWTVDRIVDEVAARLERTVGEVQRILRSETITSPYLPPVAGPIDELNRWEGLLAAATYPLGPSTTPEVLLTAMADEATRRLDDTDWSRLDALGVSRHEVLTIASLVEREAGTDDERDEIASVIYNRLAVPMRLQIDATVIYALGFNPGRVTADDLRIASPWNTYRIDGLPPTPIGTPSVASINAAADPADTPYLFYVLGFEDGSHRFAESYEGHQANIERARADGILP
jgi:UPF0755 protein